MSAAQDGDSCGKEVKAWRQGVDWCVRVTAMWNSEHKSEDGDSEATALGLTFGDRGEQVKTRM